jgi:hypothetical protein
MLQTLAMYHEHHGAMNISVPSHNIQTITLTYSSSARILDAMRVCPNIRFLTIGGINEEPGFNQPAAFHTPITTLEIHFDEHRILVFPRFLIP